MKDFRAERGVALACLLLGLCVADTWAAYGPAKAGGSGQGVIIGADPEDVEANPVPHGVGARSHLAPTSLTYMAACLCTGPVCGCSFLRGPR